MDYITLIVIFIAKYLIVVPPIIYAIYFLKNNKKRKMFVYGIGILLISVILALIASSLFYNPRPFVVENVAPLFEHEPDNGFPSNHALVAAIFAAALLPFSRKISVVLWIVALLIGLARVYAGVHHLIDIIASLLIALISVALVHYAILKN